MTRSTVKIYEKKAPKSEPKIEHNISEMNSNFNT